MGLPLVGTIVILKKYFAGDKSAAGSAAGHDREVQEPDQGHRGAGLLLPAGSPAQQVGKKTGSCNDGNPVNFSSQYVSLINFCGSRLIWKSFFVIQKVSNSSLYDSKIHCKSTLKKR